MRAAFLDMATARLAIALAVGSAMTAAAAAQDHAELTRLAGNLNQLANDDWKKGVLWWSLGAYAACMFTATMGKTLALMCDSDDND